MLSIANEVDPLILHCVCFVWDTNMFFSNNWYQSSLQFWICITCFSISRVSINWEFPSIDRMFFFDRLNRNRESIELTRDFVMNFFNFSTVRELLSTDRICLFNQLKRNRESIESSRKLVKIYYIISIDQEIHSIDRKLWILNFF